MHSIISTRHNNFSSSTARKLLFAAVTAAALLYAAGCGGGGGGTPAPQPSTSSVSTPAPGFGKVSASFNFDGPTAARAAAQTTSTSSYIVTISISVSGYYSGTGEAFAPVTTDVTIDLATTYSAKVVLPGVPTGINHLITATASFPGGSTETLKAIIPLVEKDVSTSTSADHRTTVIAEAAEQLAAKSSKTLADITSAEISKIASSVDAMYAAGVMYYNMSVSDVLNYDTISGVPATITLTPPYASITTGSQQQFSASVVDAFGAAATSQTVTWSVSPSTLGSLSTAGLFLASATGTGVITASSGSISATAAISVIDSSTSTSTPPVPTPSYIVISPTSVTLDASGTAYFTATVYDSTGATMSAMPTWSMSNSVATVDLSGIVTAGSSGSGVLTASYSGISATAAVTVLAASPTVLAPTVGSVDMSQSASLQFTVIDGQSPFSWAVPSGYYLPSGLSMNSSTGVISGTLPDYIGVFSIPAEVTDGAGRTATGSVTITISRINELNEMYNIQSTADAALAQIDTLLQSMRTLAITVAGGGGTPPSEDTQYQSMMAQIDSIATSTTFTSTMLTNGPVLLDGSYSSTTIQIKLLGGASPVYFNESFGIFTSSSLGLGGSSIVDMATASSTVALLDMAISSVASSRTDIGATQQVVNLIITDNNTAMLYPAGGLCLEDLYNVTGAGYDILGTTTNVLNSIRSIVVASSSPGADKTALQMQVSAYVNFLDVASMVARYRDSIMFDGAFSMTCTGAPVVSLPSATSSALGVSSIYLPSVTDTTPILSAIDASLANLSSAQSNIYSQKTTIGSLLGLPVGPL